MNNAGIYLSLSSFAKNFKEKYGIEKKTKFCKIIWKGFSATQKDENNEEGNKLDYGSWIEIYF